MKRMMNDAREETIWLTGVDLRRIEGAHVSSHLLSQAANSMRTVRFVDVEKIEVRDVMRASRLPIIV